MLINKRVKNMNRFFEKIKIYHRSIIITALIIAGGIGIAYGFNRVENSVMTYVPVSNPEKPIIVLDAGHGGYVLNRVAGAIWFLTKKKL